MIKYALRENLLTAEPDDYMAQVTDAKAYSLDEIIDRMTRRGTTVTRTDIVAIMQLYADECAAIVEEGGCLNTPLVNTSYSITGVFSGEDDNFDKSHHTLKLNVTPGTLLKEAVKKAKTTKVESSSTDPYITKVSDKVTSSTSEIRAGSVMEILGSRLKFDAADSEQGVFAVSSSDGKAYRCPVVIENKPARVIVLLDASVPAGEFTVEIRTKMGSTGHQLKTLKTGRFRKTLTATAQ